MTKRTKIVAGNWKMNKTFQEAESLLSEIAERINAEDLEKTSVVVFPPAVYLELANDILHGTGIFHGAQNISDKQEGAFTGEISAQIVASAGANFVIVGHSERRTFFGETDELLAIKIKTAINNGLTPVYCCGERLQERTDGVHKKVVGKQINTALFGFDPDNFEKIIIAYEPVWAIGTGVNATPEQAQEMHDCIRKLVDVKYGKEIAAKTVILYGGSCNSKNAPVLFSQPDVDGGLIGGASLNAEEFVKIVRSF